MVQGHDHPLLLRTLSRRRTRAGLRATRRGGRVASAKTRYRQADAACIVTRSDDEEIAMEFAQPQWAVTPGQSVVLYDGDVCLGGAVIQ